MERAAADPSRPAPLAPRMPSSARSGRFWLAIAPALLIPCLGAVAYFVLFKESGLVRVLYGASKAFTLVWPVVAGCLLLDERWVWPKLGRRDARAVGWGVASGMLIGLAMIGLYQGGLGQVIAAGAPAIRRQAGRFGILEHYWTFGLLLSTLHSLLEEYYWRWFVYGRLRRAAGPWLAHGVAGVGFAAHHVVITGVYFGWGWGVVLGAGVGLGGMIWSVMYERQRTLLGAWASHLIADVAIMAVGHHALWGRWW